MPLTLLCRASSKLSRNLQDPGISACNLLCDCDYDYSRRESFKHIYMMMAITAEPEVSFRAFAD